MVQTRRKVVTKPSRVKCRCGANVRYYAYEVKYEQSEFVNGEYLFSCTYVVCPKCLERVECRHV